MGLDPEERSLLLRLAREALERGVCGEPLPILELEILPLKLREPGASFVTLTNAGRLRGCIGTLEARLPLAEDVRLHAVAAATQDYRFPPVEPAELPAIRIEVSSLTKPAPVDYLDPDDLIAKLCVGVDGVILIDGLARATFLPQVWDKIPVAADFLSHLCYKMGALPDLWRKKHLEVYTYQVEIFHETA